MYGSHRSHYSITAHRAQVASYSKSVSERVRQAASAARELLFYLRTVAFCHHRRLLYLALGIIDLDQSE